MPKASLFGLRTATQMIDSDTFPMLTNAGENVRLAVSEARALVGPGWSSTVNAYNEVGVTDEIKIQAAISRAVSTGKTIVFVPSSMIPYDGAAVTFDDTIRMVREGGNYDAYDIEAYGAVGDGSTDNSDAIQAAFDGAFNAGGWSVYIPAAADPFNYGTTLEAKRGVSIIGSGINASILSYTGSTIGLNIAGSGGGDLWYCTYKDFCLTTPNATPPYAGTTYGIKVDDASGILYDRIRLTHWGTAAVALDAAVVCVTHLFDTCTIEENNGGIYVISASNGLVNHIGIRNGAIRNNEEYHIYTPVDIRNWLVSGVNLEAGKTVAVRMNYCTGVKFDTCYFEQIGAVPCFLLADVQPGFAISIVNNILMGTGATNGASCIKIGVGGAISDGVVITGNFISSWQVGVEYNGIAAGQVGPNAVSDVTTPYKPAISGNLGVTLFDLPGQRNSGTLTADRGDASVTLVPGTDWKVQRFNTALTATRTVTLGTTNNQNGDTFRIVRQAGATGAFNLNVGSGPLKSLTAAGQWCDVIYDAYWTQTWSLIASGTL